MLIYSIGLIITALLMLLAQISYNKSSLVNCDVETNINTKFRVLYIVFLCLSILPLTLISSLRYGVGTDYFFTYVPRFYQCINMENAYEEFGFQYLNILIGFITRNYIWIFIATSIIFNVSIFLSIVKLSDSWPISCLMFVLGNVYFISLNNVRQSCAMALVIMSYAFLKENKLFKFIFLSFLAISFHYTSLAIILIVLLLEIPLIKKYYFPISIFLLVFSPIIYNLMAYLFSFTNYYGYFEPGKDLPLFPYLFPHLMILFFMILARKRIKNEMFNLLFVVSSIVFVVSIISIKLRNNETLSRICNLFDWGLVFSTPFILKVTNNKIINYVLMALFLVLVFICSYYTFVILGHHEVFPYRTIINPEWRWY